MDLQALIPQLLLAFGAVIGLMALLAFVAKRFGVRGPAGSRGTLTVHATLNLGNREKIVVVNYDGKEYLLGVTASTITPITAQPATLDPASKMAEPAP